MAALERERGSIRAGAWQCCVCNMMDSDVFGLRQCMVFMLEQPPKITPHMFRVPSKANIADPFSRMDFDISTQLGWRVLEPPHRAILKRTVQILGNTSFAHETGFENVQDIKTFHDVLLSPSSAL